MWFPLVTASYRADSRTVTGSEGGFEHLPVKGERRLDKRSISAKALLEDIRKGLSDAELMGRHELSPGQMQKVLAKLVNGGHIAQAVLDVRKRVQTKTSSAGPRGSNVPVMETGSHLPEPLTPVPPERYSSGPTPRQAPQPGAPQTSAPSLPLSQEEAARVRRNGLVLVLVSLGLITMGMILATLREHRDPSSFSLQPIGGVLAAIASIGWLVISVLGCLWRVRGLGQNAFWAIVAPIPGVNLVVLEALSNRYEPDTNPRGFRITFAASCVLAWFVALSQVVKLF